MQSDPVLARDDAYDTVGKPPCDWDDRDAREALVDALVRDAHAALGALDGEVLPAGAAGAADLLALVAGQDTEEGDDGVFRIVRGVAKDRIISTVDPEARHGHKSRNRRFDGYKAHLSIDPDSELIDEVAVTAAKRPTATRSASWWTPSPRRRTSRRSWATRPMPTGRPEPLWTRPASP